MNMHPWDLYEYSYQEFAWKLKGWQNHQHEYHKAIYDHMRHVAFFVAPNDKHTVKLPLDKRIPSIYDTKPQKTEKELKDLMKRGLARSKQLDEKRKKANAGQEVSNRGRDRSNGNGRA